MSKYGIILIIMIAIISSHLVEAISIGVSPGRIRLDNMLKGGYSERIVRISTNSEKEIIARFDLKGDIIDWLRFEPENRTFALSLGNSYELKIIVEPPEDARSDSYSGSISFITERFGNISGRAGGFVKAGVTSLIDIVVSDDETKACNAGGFDLKDIEIGFPLELSLIILNEGNVRIKPTISFDIWDQGQEKLVMSEEFIGPEILPTTREKATRSFPNNLEIGQYWAIVSADDCGASDLLTFSVVDKGGILDKGTFEGIINKLWVYAGEPVEIKARFKNEGPRTAYSKFKGDIKLDNRIVNVIETEEIDVPSMGTADLVTYFTPEEPGRYVITGRIIYNRKLSFEKSGILNVNPVQIKKNAIIPPIIPLMIYILILVTIIFLVRRIIKTKKRF